VNDAAVTAYVTTVTTGRQLRPRKVTSQNTPCRSTDRRCKKCGTEFSQVQGL